MSLQAWLAGRSRTWRRHALLGACACGLAPAAFGAAWGGSLGASSDYVFRGVTQSDGEPSVQADAHYYAPAGWFAGLWAASVKRGPDHLTAELNAYLGWSAPIAGPWNATLAAVHYDYPWNRPRQHYNYDELVGTLAYSDRAFLTVAASPDTAFEDGYGGARRGAAYSGDLAFHAPLRGALSANGGIGYYDVRRQLGAGYAYWSLGLGYDLGAVQLQVSYVGTSAVARTLFDDDAGQRWNAGALWHF